MQLAVLINVFSLSTWVIVEQSLY